MTQTSEGRTRCLLSSLGLIFAVYSSLLFAFAVESRPPYSWSAQGRYLYFWHPHAVSLSRTDFIFFYGELLLIPAFAIFVCLKLIGRRPLARPVLRTIWGIVAVSGLPVACLYAGGRPFFFAVIELAIAASCFLLWAYRKWPVSAPLSVFLLILHYAFWFLFSVVRTGLVIRPWARWGVWDYMLVVFPALGFAYSLVWAVHFRQSDTKAGLRRT